MLCPCRECRPRSESLRHAIKRINRAVEVARYGVQGAALREEAKRARLEMLKARKA